MELRIDELLEKRGIRKADLARKTGLTQSNLNSAIKGGNPTIGTLEKIAKALGVEVYELLTDRLPSRPEGVVYLGGSAYAMVKMPNIVQIPNYPDCAALSGAIEEFVEHYVGGAQIASICGIYGTDAFFVIYDPESEYPRLLLSVTSGSGSAYNIGYNIDEYQAEIDEDGYVNYDCEAITKELLHEIEGIDRGKQLHNTCVLDFKD